MSYYCYLHGWASPVESCPKCVTVTTSITTDIPAAEFYRRELESEGERNLILKDHLFALQAQVDTLTAALEVIASNGEGRGMGWTPAQHARQALAAYQKDGK